MNEPRYNYGTVELEMDGRTFILRPTLEASDKIDREFGGVRGAAQQVAAMNLTAIARIVAIAVGTPSRKGEEALREKIHYTGRITVAEKVGEYLMKLNDPTGKMAEEDESEVDEGND